MNDSLRPLPRPGRPSDAASSMPASSLDSSDSYNGDDARRYLHEWRMAQNHYSEVTWENGQLEIHLEVSEATPHAAEEEASAVRAWQPSLMPWWRVRQIPGILHSNFHYLYLDSLLFL